MNAQADNRVRSIIEYLVAIAEASPNGTGVSVVAAEVKASDASDRDVALAFSMLVNALQEHLKSSEPATELVACNFCHKSQRDVKTMVQGPTAAICNECIGICQEVLSSRQGLIQRFFSRRK